MGSRELHREALGVMPGGVSSPVRAFPPHPRYLTRGRGPRVEDVDGRSYIDVCMAYGALVLGHAPPAVVAAIETRAGRGTIFGAPTEEELHLAKRVQHHVPSMERLRLVSTGAEATMHVLRAARAFTGRDDIVAVEGGYHGAHDALLVKAGPGAATLASSAGVPADVVRHTHLVPFNDLPALEALLGAQGDTIAAMIVEPVLGNIGPVPPEPGYLEGLRRLTEAHGVLLIFDEVITGFRLGLGGAQGLFGIKPDLTTLGKVLGGGLPLAAFGGRREIMDLVAPVGPVYQAGTFSGNPLSCAAGLATLEALERGGHGGLERWGNYLRSGLRDVVEELGLGFTVAGLGSMFQLFLTPRRVLNFDGALACDRGRFMELFQGLLDRGVYLPASQLETCFLSTSHGEAEVEALLQVYRDALKGLGR